MATNYPVINIGLGTTGGEIVTLIARIIRHEGDQWCKDYVESLVLLSEAEPPQEVDAGLVRNIIHLCPGNTPTKIFVDNFANAKDPSVAKVFRLWYPHDANAVPAYPPCSTFEEGCAGFRPSGRLLLHRIRAKGESVRTQLSSLFHSIDQRAADQIRNQKVAGQDIDPSKIICNVYGMLAGGTASGLFLDFALLLRSAAEEQEKKVFINGYFLTGDTCYAPILPSHRSMTRVTMQRRNTIKALVEVKPEDDSFYPFGTAPIYNPLRKLRW